MVEVRQAEVCDLQEQELDVNTEPCHTYHHQFTVTSQKISICITAPSSITHNMTTVISHFKGFTCTQDVVQEVMKSVSLTSL